MDERRSLCAHNRVPFFDLLRGVGIFLVVFGHVTHDMPLRGFIYGFHLPLFFFISGALFHPRNRESFWCFFRRKARALLVPYIVFALVTLFWYLLVEIRVRPIEATLPQIVLGLCYGAYTKWIWFNGALWFLPCLFTSECLLWIVLRVSGARRPVQWGLAILGYGLGEAALFFVPFPLPFGLEKAGRFLVFLLLGHSMQMLLCRTMKPRQRLIFGILVCVVAGGILSFLPNGWFGRQLGVSLFYDFVVAVPVAVFGISLCAGFCWTISRFRPLEFLGRHSLVFFAFQEQCYRLWLGLLSRVFHRSVESIRTEFWGSFFVAVVAFISMIPLAWIWSRVSHRILPGESGSRLFTGRGS